MKIGNLILGGITLVTVAIATPEVAKMLNMGKIRDANHLNEEKNAQIELRDSFNLSTKEFAQLKDQKTTLDISNFWQEQRKIIGRKKLAELSKTPKQYDSIVDLITTGKNTYSTALKNLKANADTLKVIR